MFVKLVVSLAGLVVVPDSLVPGTGLRQAVALASMAALERARTDINAFVEYALTDETGAPLRQGAIHRRWHAHTEQYARAGILACRDHGKSIQFAIARPIFELGRNPNLRIKIVSNDLPKARKRLRAIRQNIERNPRIAEVFPHIVPVDSTDDWSMDSFTVPRLVYSPNPSVEARGILTAGTGDRADLIIFDDVCDYRNSIKNPAERARVKHVFFEDWINLLEPHGRVIYIATLWSRFDLTHVLLQNAEWCFLKTLVNRRLDPIWPEKWSRAALQQRAAEIGDVAFARGYQGIIRATNEESHFAPADLEMAKDFDLTPSQALEVTRSWPKFFGVDLAAGKRTRGSKWSVIVAVAVDPTNRQRIPIAIERRREPAGRFMERLANMAEVLNPDVIVVENNAIQQALIDLARQHELRGLPIKPMHTGHEKMDLEVGLPGMAADFGSGLWRLPFGGPRHATSCPCNLCVFLDECRDGTLSEHTDILMAAWLATRLIKHRARGDLSLSLYGTFRDRASPSSGDQVAPAQTDPYADIMSPVRGHSRLPHHDPGW